MPVDTNARKLSLGFTGGSLTATRGLLVQIFGEALVQQNELQEITVNRAGHSRVRVIGGDSTAVKSSSYTRKRYGTSNRGAAAGGEAIRIFVDGDWWTARLNGSHQAFNAWLGGSTWASGKVVMWQSEKGKGYGPFGSSSNPLANVA